MNFETHLSQKNSFRFNELTSIVGVKPYVLRFWESEFEQINPNLSDSGDKEYSANDLDKIKRIKNLLFDEKLSIPEAKKRLDEDLTKAMAEIKAAEVRDRIIMAEETIEENTYTGVALQSSSLDLMKKALGEELTQKEEILEKDVPFQASRQISDKDIVHLIQAKKKLTSVLSKINDLVIDNNW